MRYNVLSNYKVYLCIINLNLMNYEMYIACKNFNLKNNHLIIKNNNYININHIDSLVWMLSKNTYIHFILNKKEKVKKLKI